MTRAVLFVGRLLFGGYFLYAGLDHFIFAQKMMTYAAARHVPPVFVPLSGALIVIGGLHVLLGLMPRFGLLLIILFLVPVTFVMHAFWADTDPQQRVSNLISFTKNLALIGGALGLMAVNVPWPFSVDSALARGSRSVGRPIPH
jgi:uncharacterized membrane protein YphA (DoxX/SURF4 family)